MAEEDWLFDYVLQFLESDKFDSVIMDFIDEKCEVFDNEEENKFIYSEVHQEFREMVETMIASNLGELGVSVDMFFEACEKGRNKRDINQAVIERMIAMDDFLTFKKIMVKRNMELQLEALKSCSFPSKKGSSRMNNPDEDVLSAEDEAAMERIIQDSIMEMEMFHIQAEMEAIEMERVLAMSLALEEEKLNVLQTELAEYERAAENEANEYYKSQSKEFVDSINRTDTDDDGDDYERQKRTKDSKAEVPSPVQESKHTAMPDSPSSPGARPAKIKAVATPTTLDAKDFEEPTGLKPLKLKQEFKPLPSISSSSGSAPSNPKAQKELESMADELEAKRKKVEAQFRMNKESQRHRKDAQHELTEKVAGSSAEDVDQRVKYMKEQREKIVAMKKREREEKVAAEERERKMAEANRSPGGSPSKDKPFDQLSESEKVEFLRKRRAREEKGLSDEAIAEKQMEDESKRSVMRHALAHRMKMDLLTTNITSSSASRKKEYEQNKQFLDLDEKLRDMDRLRDEQEEKEEELKQNINKLRGNSSKKV